MKIYSVRHIEPECVRARLLETLHRSRSAIKRIRVWTRKFYISRILSLSFLLPPSRLSVVCFVPFAFSPLGELRQCSMHVGKRISVFSCRRATHTGRSQRVAELPFIFIFVASPAWRWYSLYLSNSTPNHESLSPCIVVSPHLHMVGPRALCASIIRAVSFLVLACPRNN